MFDEEYFNRVNVQQLVSFFQYGAGKCESEEGTLEERCHRWNMRFMKELAAYRDAVLAEDWSRFRTKEEKDNRTEELFQNIISAQCALEDVALEAGIRTGLLLHREFFGEV